jgi:hypothetical protein
LSKLPTYPPLASPYPPIGALSLSQGLIGKVATGAGALSASIGLYDTVKASLNRDIGGVVQGSADTFASGVGLVGGPIGRVFSAGYTGGQILEQTLNVSDYSAAYGALAEKAARSRGAGDSLATAVGVVATISAITVGLYTALVAKLSPDLGDKIKQATNKITVDNYRR